MRMPIFEDVLAARKRLAGVALRTPLLRSPVLDERVGARVFLKAETLQRTGSFKIRGAYNRLAQLSADERAGGVVAFSSGNHAQGVAEAARLLAMPALIVMPSDAPAVKVTRTRALGAEIVLYDRYTEDREAIAGRIARERGAVVVPSYDDPDIIAGQGTAGLEAIEDAPEPIDLWVSPVGGGGLIGGCALAFEARSPATEIWGVEPAAFDDFKRSLAAGERVGNGPDARSVCDALLTPSPGRLTFQIARRRLSGILTVSDDEALSAVRFAFEELKLVVEPGGAVALAALLAGRLFAQGKTVGLILSGGNMAAERLAG